MNVMNPVRSFSPKKPSMDVHLTRSCRKHAIRVKRSSVLRESWFESYIHVSEGLHCTRSQKLLRRENRFSTTLEVMVPIILSSVSTAKSRNTPLTLHVHLNNMNEYVSLKIKKMSFSDR